VPLPFLTADRAFDATADDIALPFDDHDLWRRPYRPGPWRVGAAALVLLLASFVMLAGMIIGFAVGPGGALVTVLLGAAMVAAALRLLRMGLWVSRHGLRRVGFFVTTTLAWNQVAEVRTAQQPVKWLGLPRTVQGQALVLARQGGSAERATVMTDHNADFLGRPEAFDRAADTIEVWATEYRKD
jgi:hypothetical protein